MIKALAIEFYKTRRRKIFLVVMAMIAAQLMWALWSFSRMDVRDLEQGWISSLFQFTLLNSLMMPVICAVVASRICDVEHKGQTLKLLNTIIPSGHIFDVKFLCGAFYMILAVLFQILTILITGYLKGFNGEAPFELFGYYLLFTTAVNLSVLLLQQVLSLLFTNQMVALTVGLTGSFFGLFSLFFPQSFQKFVIWGYYGVLMFIGMDWDRATRITNYYLTPIDWAGFVMLMVQFLVLYIIGRVIFSHREW